MSTMTIEPPHRHPNDPPTRSFDEESSAVAGGLMVYGTVAVIALVLLFAASRPIRAALNDDGGDPSSWGDVEGPAPDAGVATDTSSVLQHPQAESTTRVADRDDYEMRVDRCGYSDGRFVAVGRFTNTSEIRQTFDAKIAAFDTADEFAGAYRAFVSAIDPGRTLDWTVSLDEGGSGEMTCRELEVLTNKLLDTSRDAPAASDTPLPASRPNN